MVKVNRFLLVLSVLTFTSINATIWTYTENTTTSTEFALGYPVPLPVDNLLAVDGFRSYQSLNARHLDLMLMSDNVVGSIVGQTTAGRDIWAYQLSDADGLTNEGLVEPAVMQNGGIHAREWSTPEVTTGIMERLVANENDQWLYQYLLENLNIVIQPVENVDGFMQTQRYANRVLQTQSAADPSNWPRDGRMRRKNMNNVDEVLSSEADGMLGVDLNRNNDPYWNTSTQSSSNVDSIVYHGLGATSEPETQSLQATANLGPADRLRFYVDTHSFSQLWYVPQTNNQSRNRSASNVATLMQVATNNTYAISNNSANVGIGSTDEYFATNYEIPSFTLETEPGNSGSVQYGGNGVSHAGFILPEMEIARVRNELADASIVAWYMLAAPPVVKAVEITDTSTNEIVFAGQWNVESNSTRAWNETLNAGLQKNANYRLWVSYNKPMRWIDGSGAIANFKTMVVPLAPSIKIEGKAADGSVFNQTITTASSNWLMQAGGTGIGYVNYKTDALMVEFTLGSQIDPTTSTLLTLTFDTQDFTGKRNDADPSTIVDWDTKWTNYETSQGVLSENGGVDRTIRIVDDNSAKFRAPVSSNTTTVTPSAPLKSSGGSSELLILLLLITIIIFSKLKHRYQ